MQEQINFGDVVLESPDYPVLQDHKYEKETYDVFFPKHRNVGDLPLLRNIYFKSCHFRGGILINKTSMALENVTFDNCRGNRYDIYAGNKIRNLTFKGRRKPGRLEITTSGDPDEVKGLDISEYVGDFRILGVAKSELKINPKEHVIIEKERFHGVDVDTLGLAEPLLWRLNVRRFSNSPHQTVTVMIPKIPDLPPEDRYHDINILRGLGYVD